MSTRTSAVRRALALALSLSVAGPAVPVEAAELKPRTVEAFNEYRAAVEARIDRELGSNRGFLGIDFDNPAEAASIRTRVRKGEVYVARLAARGRDAEDINVPDGLINHWRGMIFVPDLTVDRAIAELRSPATGRHQQEDVLESRLLWRDGDRSRIYRKLMRKKIVTVTYNTEHDVVYEHRGAGRMSSRSIATRIAELEDAGTPQEREKPIGQDRGFMWRLNSYWRYEQVPGGVIIELESLTLSRDIPAIIKFIAKPIINSIARESISRTLESVRSRLTGAVRAGAAFDIAQAGEALGPTGGQG